MKCALNNGDLYKTYGSGVYIGCVFEKISMKFCESVDLCSDGSIIKRNHFQSDIFKI